ncbi:hypothetical protein [Psychromonas sp. SR45-3]|nr:hypothetical protein [Psychromonas sp. SR45-3]MBB1274070.1 hypothetical protein [Psychromonas sp. SR45-3]
MNTKYKIDFLKSREEALAEIIRLVNEDDIEEVKIENKRTNKKENNNYE